MSVSGTVVVSRLVTGRPLDFGNAQVGLPALDGEVRARTQPTLRHLARPHRIPGSNRNHC